MATEAETENKNLGYYVKLPFEILFICVASIVIYFNLIFRKIVPAQRKSIENDIVLITGSSNGLGREIVHQLAKRCPGIKLVLWDLDDEGNKSTGEDARLLGANVRCYKVDVSDLASVQKAAQQVIRDVGEVTILFNNAGVALPNTFLDQTPEQIKSIMGVNYLGNMWTLKTFLPKMVENNKGHVITTCSGTAFSGMRFGANYAASKFALRGFFYSLRSELRHHSTPTDKVKFTIVYPYFIKTNMTKRVLLRTKFDYLNQFLDAAESAEIIVEGMLRNKENIFLPENSELFVRLTTSILPARLWDILEDWLLQKTTLAKE